MEAFPLPSSSMISLHNGPLDFLASKSDQVERKQSDKSSKVPVINHIYIHFMHTLQTKWRYT